MKKIIIACATLCFSFVLMQGASVPTKAQVEKNGKEPYLRYTVPAGKLNLVSNSIFQQASYDKDKDAIDKMPRKMASELGLAGAHVYNEYPGQMSPEVILSATAIIKYRQTSQGTDLYLSDCTVGKKPWNNRLRLAQETATLTLPQPAFLSAPQQESPRQIPPATPMQGAMPSMNNSNNNNVSTPPFPATFKIILDGSGLPQAPVQLPAPTNTTQHIIYDVNYHRDNFQKMESVGKTVMYVGAGVLLGSAGIEGPKVIENVARIKANASQNVANTNAVAVKYAADQSVAAAAALRPTSIKITTSASPTLTGGNNSANPVATATPTVTNSPTISSTNSNDAQGGQGGPGGGGGSASVTYLPGAVQAFGGSADGGSATSSGGNSSSSATGGSPTATSSGGNSSSNSNANGGSTTVVSGSNSNSGSNSDSTSKSGSNSNSTSSSDNQNSNSNSNDNNNTAGSSQPSSGGDKSY
jgi:hypothetical protein